MPRVVVAAAVAVVGLLLSPSAAMAVEPAVDGYQVASTVQVANGVTHTVLRRAGPEQVVHVARMSPGGGVRLRAVLSNEAVSEHGPRLERTSSMCARVSCVVAVNADFAAVGSDEPVGGMVVDGEIVRTPVASHHQLVVDGGRLAAGGVDVRAQLVSTDLNPLPIDGVNRPRDDGQLVLYTAVHGPSTGTNPHGVEIAAELGGGRLIANQTIVARLVSIVEGGNAPIPRGGAVLSGHGRAADALRQLWERVRSGSVASEVMVRADTSPSGVTMVGGTPVLVHEGQRWAPESGDNFVSGRHPRTVVGWTANGDVLLVTIDGRQPGHSAGITLAEAADLMIGFGAVEALNLDGGGSTTFVVKGQVTNAPSDRVVRRSGKEQLVHQGAGGDTVAASVERPVVSALAIVEDAPQAPASAPLTVPRPPAKTVPHLVPADPASSPTGPFPAVVVAAPREMARPLWLAAAVLVLTAVSTASGLTARRRRTSPPNPPGYG